MTDTNIYDLVQRESVLLHRVFKRFLFIYIFMAPMLYQEQQIEFNFRRSIII